MPNLFIGDHQNIAFSGNSLQVINSGILTADKDAAVTGVGTQIIHGAGSIIKGLVTVVTTKAESTVALNFGRVAESGQDDLIASYEVNVATAGTYEIDLSAATVVSKAITEGCYCFGLDQCAAGADEAVIVVQLVVAPYTV